MLSYFVFAANNAVGRTRRDDRGMTTVEGGLILALMAAIAITVVLLLIPAVGILFSNSASCAASGVCAGP